MRPYPLIFHPIFKEKIWGGRILEQLGKALPPNDTIGESWELADVETESGDGRSIISNGELAGKTLHDAIADHGRMIMGRHWTAAGAGPLFPLLIKYLDAHENLSVQVHPSEAYVAAHPETSSKHEAWVILQTRADACIYHGFKPGTTPQQVRMHLANGDVASLLNAISVEPGQCYYIPSGTVHALGAGVTLAEVQTTSDWTFRLYDWGREYSPQAREMHIEQALQCIDFDTSHPVISGSAFPPPVQVDGLKTQLLTQTPHFTIERMSWSAQQPIEIVTNDLPEVWMVLSGRGLITVGNEPILDMQRGMTVLMPAALSESGPAYANVSAGATILRVSLPSMLKGKIA